MSVGQQSRQRAQQAPLLQVENVSRVYRFARHSIFEPRRALVAVDGASFQLQPGRTLGLVGESGSGKSTIGKMILRLERPDTGIVRFNGHDIFAKGGEEAKRYRAQVQVVLQDPYGALSPRMRIESIVSEPLIAQGVARGDALERAGEMLEFVGLDRNVMRRHPHQFSGGQRQRIAIARALSVEPRLVVLDEAVSALDVSVRAQILLLLKSIQERLGNSYVFIGHDLAMVRFMSDEVAVMYFGRIVEIGPAATVLGNPKHPYTRHLVDTARGDIPLDEKRRPTELPDPFSLPSGCRFRTRCPLATAECESREPALLEAGVDHSVACHYAERESVSPERFQGLQSASISEEEKTR